MTITAQIILPNKYLKRTHYRLTEELPVLGHVIPVGFISDGATTPRILWPIYPPMGPWAESAFLHDWLLQEGHRSYAHDEFYEALLNHSCIGENGAWAMYTGVKLHWGAKEFISKFK